MWKICPRFWTLRQSDLDAITLKKICVEDDSLEFLSSFLELAEGTFVEQINTDLDYLTPGQNLFDQMINTIRGIVEIEKAERDKKLQNGIALVATGLTVSGISSQTDAKPVEAILTERYPNQSLDCPKAGLNPCLIYSSAYILFHVGIGAIAALVLGLIIWLVSKLRKQN